MNLSATTTGRGLVKFLALEEGADRADWLDLWRSWPGREIMAHPDYVRLFARPGDRVVAATVRGVRGGVIYPVIVRPLGLEPWGPNDGRVCDLTTAYGYGGPFAWDVTADETRGFWDRFDEWAGREGVISSFARLSLFPETQLPFPGTVQTRCSNIVRRLDLPLEEIWSDYSHKVRKNVHRARSLEISVEADSSGERLDDFLGIYTSTMRRREASSEYYHPRAFFEAIIRDIPGHFVFFHAFSRGRVVATELVLLAEDRAYSFFGGSLEEAFETRATDLLKHEIVRWCRLDGRKMLVLGGGYREDDGVFRFKKAFAPNGELPFRLGHKVYDADLVAHFVRQRRGYEATLGNKWEPAPGYFPAYRA